MTKFLPLLFSLYSCIKFNLLRSASSSRLVFSAIFRSRSSSACSARSCSSRRRNSAKVDSCRVRVAFRIKNTYVTSVSSLRSCVFTRKNEKTKTTTRATRSKLTDLSFLDSIFQLFQLFLFLHRFVLPFLDKDFQLVLDRGVRGGQAADFCQELGYFAVEDGGGGGGEGGAGAVTSVAADGNKL